MCSACPVAGTGRIALITGLSRRVLALDLFSPPGQQVGEESVQQATGKSANGGPMGNDDRHRRSSDRERARGEHVDSRSGHPSGSSRHGDRDDRRGASDSRSSRKASKRSRSRSRSRSSGSDHQRRRRERGHSRSRSRERSHERSRRKSRWGNHERRQQDAPESEDEGDKIAEEEDAAEPLPVTLFKDELMKAVRGSQVLVCTGETGSGKTTQIPQYLLELVRERDADTTASGGKDKDKDEGVALDTPAPGDGKRSHNKKKLLVAVTQPRRVAATSVAKRVADERGCRLGEEVGYSIRFEDRTGPRTRIKYMTDGVLVRECLEDPYLSRYGVVMLDEAHERSIDTDILFGLLKRALARRPDLRAVITSATLDVERFAAFFDGCPFISVPGRTHAVDVYHSKTRQVRERAPASCQQAFVLVAWFIVSTSSLCATVRGPAYRCRLPLYSGDATINLCRAWRGTHHPPSTTYGFTLIYSCRGTSSNILLCEQPRVASSLNVVPSHTV